MKTALIFNKIAELALELGVESINKMKCCWECKIDGDWEVIVNGHDKEIDLIPPFSALIKYKDVPCGLIDPFGGNMIISKDVSEDKFINAINRDLYRLMNA